MGVRRTDEMRMQAVRYGDVVEIAALPGDEAEVLFARQWRADGMSLGHRVASARRRAAAFITAVTML